MVEKELSKHLTAASMSCRERFKRKNSRLSKRLDGFSFNFLGSAASMNNLLVHNICGVQNLIIMEGMGRTERERERERDMSTSTSDTSNDTLLRQEQQ